MAFPDDVLADDEQLVLHLHPHARVALGPSLMLLLTLSLTLVAWVMLPQNFGGHLAFAVVAAIMLYHAIRYGIRPLAIWRCTHYVLTDERVVLQDGVIARQRRDVPLNRVNDHAMTQSLVDRVFGSGTLVIDSIGDQAVVLAAVPHAHEVQTTLYELIEQDRVRHPDDDEEETEEPEVPVQRRGLFGRRAVRELGRGAGE